VRAQLERILANGEFKAPERARNFLRYVVEETLAGHSARIKAFSIAVEVFGRDATFDAQNDPVVRIEAGRLRRALERYYLVAGQDDSIDLDIPKGGYVPTFTWRRQEQPAQIALEGIDSTLPAPQSVPPVAARRVPGRRATIAALFGAGLVVLCIIVTGAILFGWSPWSRSVSPNGPSLIIRPFADLGGSGDSSLYAAGLTEEILSQIARFRELKVIGSETSRNLPSGADVAQLRRQFGVGYVLEGAVRVSDGRLRVTSRVVDAESSAVIWSQAYDEDLRSRDLVRIEVDIAGKVATTVAQPYGIIFHADEQRAARVPPDDLEAYQCTLRFYNYRALLSAEAHASVRSCLERAVERHPAYATAWAMLSYIYLDEDRFGFNATRGEPAIARALEAARRAVRLDPESTRALQALMAALFFNGQAEEALRVGARAYALNPNDTELLGEYGSRVAQAGDWGRGAALIEEALVRNPGNSGYYTGMLGFAAYMQGDDAKAVALIRRTDLTKFPLYYVIAALIYTRAGFTQEAAESRARFLAMRPTFFDDLEGELAKRNFSPTDRRILTEAARAAGFPVPVAPAPSNSPGSPP
jgi:adenylate cyclase